MINITIEAGAIINVTVVLPPDPIPDESLAMLQATINDANAFAQSIVSEPLTATNH